MTRTLTLTGTRIAILATDGVEESELTSPRDALEAAGATCEVVSPSDHLVTGDPDRLRALDTLSWSGEYGVDVALEEADPERYDALYLPGGIINPDLLRLHPRTPEFIRAFVEHGKPVASMCHGPWNLIEADVVRGRTLTSWPSLRVDLQNAGATWVDRQVCRDEWLITCRNPGDLDAFNPALVEHFAGVRRSQPA